MGYSQAVRHEIKGEYFERFRLLFKARIRKYCKR